MRVTRMACVKITAPRYSIGKVRISAATMAKTLRLLDQFVQAGKPAYVCVCNVRTAVLAQRDKEFCNIQNNSLLSIPDGMPLVWFARLAGITGVERVIGADLMAEVFTESVQSRYSHYFLGDTEETLTKMTQMVRDHFPGIAIVGTLSPPFRDLSDGEMDDIADKINLSRPSFVWVALGAPKQERFMARLVTRLDCSILVGVGAGFRFTLGEYKHPPKIFQLFGLEGVFWRFSKDPLREAWWYCCHVPWVCYFMLLALCVRIRRPSIV